MCVRERESVCMCVCVFLKSYCTFSECVKLSCCLQCRLIYVLCLSNCISFFVLMCLYCLFVCMVFIYF